jgi:hypothetical protein
MEFFCAAAEGFTDAAEFTTGPVPVLGGSCQILLPAAKRSMGAEDIGDPALEPTQMCEPA